MLFHHRRSHLQLTEHQIQWPLLHRHHHHQKQGHHRQRYKHFLQRFLVLVPGLPTGYCLRHPLPVDMGLDYIRLRHLTPLLLPRNLENQRHRHRLWL